MSYYVYAIYESEESDPFYIGKGCGYRITATLYDQHSSFLKKQKIEKLRNCGIEPIVKILEEFETEEATLVYEETMISFYGKIIDGSGILTNLKDGGEGSPNWIPSEETRKLWSRQRKGIKHTSEHVEKRRKKLIGQNRSIEQKENIKRAKILQNKENKIKVLEQLQKHGKKYGLFRKLSNEYGIDVNTITRMYNNLDYYEEVLKSGE